MRTYFSICGLVLTRALLSIAVILVVALVIAVTMLRTARFESDKSSMRAGSADGGASGASDLSVHR